MPKIVAVTTAVPPHRVGQSEARSFAARLFAGNLADVERLLPLFNHSGIRTRYFSAPIDWFGQPHSLEEKNNLYIQSATALGASACRQLFEKTGITPDRIDYIIYINTTGLATPSIDARLINVLNLRHNIRRTPIWGLGCAGGAAGLAHAYHYLLGHRSHRVLVVAAELCGLTFIHDDFSKSNLVACALFGEGAAAALVSGDDTPDAGLEILATQSTFYPDSLNVMGWNIVSHGMQVVFDKRIPDIVAEYALDELQTFLGRHHLHQRDIAEYLYHPGGMTVVEAYEKAYGVNGDVFALPREILSEFGNMSSVTVLFVLARYLERCGSGNGGYGIVSALGPGFCSESLLVKL